MFENIIGQAAALQIKEDIAAGNLTQSMLFYGPSESAKGSCAIELARVLSCEKEAEDKCACASCTQYRYLQNDDLLVFGKRKFSAEIAACQSVFLKSPSQKTFLVFFRSLRKLQMRFSPSIAEGDPKIAKLSSDLLSFDEKMNDLFSDYFTIQQHDTEISKLEKLCTSLLKDAQALDEEGISENIPISHIRNASFWCRMAPLGKRKIMIIENADKIKEEGRNCLLKLLEEPPPSVTIILTAQRKEAIIPTILSRLRPYRFLNRSAEDEKKILKDVFNVLEIDTNNTVNGCSSSLITSYLDSFISFGEDKLLPQAQWFTEQDFSGNINNNEIVKALLAKTNNFENDSFPRFIKLCLDLAANNIRKTAAGTAASPQYIKYYDQYKKYLNEAVTAVDIYNQSITLALEALLYKLKAISG